MLTKDVQLVRVILNGYVVFADGVHGNYRMVRNPERKEGEVSCIYTGTKPTYKQEDFVLTPVKKGSA
jgi:hypothetical protein